MFRGLVFFILMIIVTGCSSPVVDIEYDVVVEDLEARIVELESTNLLLMDENLNLQNKLETLKGDKEAVEEEKEQLRLTYDEYIKVHKENRDVFTALSEIAHQFIIARVTGDFDKLRQLLSDRYELTENEGIIFMADLEVDPDYRWIIHNNGMEERYIDKVLRTQWYNPEDDTYMIGAMEYLESDNRMIGFLDLTFKKIDNDWKIVRVELDI